jgi:hypothetical protein
MAKMIKESFSCRAKNFPIPNSSVDNRLTGYENNSELGVPAVTFF